MTVAAPPPLQWDLFCRVVDNFGDIGVCWRLARDLAARGDRVRLWVDDASALAWLAPDDARGVEVAPFEAAQEPGDVVVEAFGCDPPLHFVAAMATQPPVWINLEYLSAEAGVERLHRLPSPQRNGLTKWFYYPGYTRATGGLLRETTLLDDHAAFDRTTWLARHGIDIAPGERLVSLFCYANPAVPALLQRLADAPTLLLLTPGPARQQVHGQPLPERLRTLDLPWLSQPDYDRLLWSCELNFVRGEDSLVRAIWAGTPFVWQIYPQHDGVHAAKLAALLERMPRVAGLSALWQAWNTAGPVDAALPALPDPAPWRRAAMAWRTTLAAQADLVTQLRSFARGKMAPLC